MQTLWNMRLAVFVKPEHESRISHVNTASVKTGLGNALGRLPYIFTPLDIYTKKIYKMYNIAYGTKY